MTYEKSFKEEAVRLSDEIGVKKASEQRGIACGLRRLTRLMREHGWLNEHRRRPKGMTKVARRRGRRRTCSARISARTGHGESC